jgi:hypothetical protein
MYATRTTFPFYVAASCHSHANEVGGQLLGNRLILLTCTPWLHTAGPELYAGSATRSGTSSRGTGPASRAGVSGGTTWPADAPD